MAFSCLFKVSEEPSSARALRSLTAAKVQMISTVATIQRVLEMNAEALHPSFYVDSLLQPSFRLGHKHWFQPTDLFLGCRVEHKALRPQNSTWHSTEVSTCVYTQQVDKFLSALQVQGSGGSACTKEKVPKKPEHVLTGGCGTWLVFKLRKLGPVSAQVGLWAVSKKADQEQCWGYLWSLL